MQLIYFDESGNTGNNLTDKDQPIFVLGALIVADDDWQRVERDLDQAVRKHFPKLPHDAEIHGTDLRSGRGHFAGIAVEQRVDFRDAWLNVAKSYRLRFVYRPIVKKRYAEWLQDAFGPGVLINPHIAAFPLVATVVNSILIGQRDWGMFISDENKEIVRDVERSIRQLRLMAGSLHLSRIVEKGFFIDSSKSRLLQLCDLCVLHARKKEEVARGHLAKSVDSEGIRAVESLIYKGEDKVWDVVDWLKKEEQKKERPGS